MSRTTLAAIAGVLALSVVLEGQDLDTIVHQVDGEPVGDASEAIRTFLRLAGSKTQQQEFERLRDVNAKYSLGYAAWGSTLNPFRSHDFHRYSAAPVK